MSRLAGTLSFYGRWARVYDWLATAPVVGGWRDAAVADLDLDPGNTVVEMGCGTGANFPFLREAVGPEGRVLGVDLVPEMLGRARNRVERAGWENVHVVRGDATRPPVDEPADGLLATFVVGMLPEPGRAVRDWLTLVVPGGRLVLLNASRSPHPLAAPLNLGLRAFVRVNAAGSRTTRASPVRRLEHRVDAAGTALAEATTATEETRMGLGLLRRIAGTRPPGPQRS